MSVKNASQRPAYHLLAELEGAYEQLVETSEQLYDCWKHNPGQLWSLNQQPATNDWLRNALFDYWYQDGQDGRATNSYIGLVAARPAVMEAVATVNQAKAHFAQLIASIRQDAPKLIAEIKTVIPFRHPSLHDHLSGSGMARLHIKQCWRAIPTAPAKTRRVQLAWYVSGRSIKRLSVNDAERMLMALDTEAAHIRQQLKALASIQRSEPLAQMQTQAPVMRANLFFDTPLSNGKVRQAKNIALPLFVPSVDGQLPEHNQPEKQPPNKRQRAIRSDQRLEEQPFLPSIRAYRYR
ncbi:hypothetical protein [Halomonas halocynthiae]|uniref:hypothetical protein n=1 Tax=Halomonas halocynthiae TaxID=176290 RepID=UPI0004105541|nr:hypothetical protein [Halomonas halocynthiae]